MATCVTKVCYYAVTFSKLNVIHIIIYKYMYLIYFQYC